MYDEEQVEIRIKARFEGRESVSWLRWEAAGFDFVSAAREATLFDSMQQAFDVMEEVAPSVPDAVLSVVEEGFAGDLSGLDRDSLPWRHF